MESNKSLTSRKVLHFVCTSALFMIAVTALSSQVAKAQSQTTTPTGVTVQTPLDKNLAPTGEDSFSNVFRDMGVVQRRAMGKGNRFLISNYGSLDFSDGPYSMYGFNIDAGYAISDFWEIYVNYTPYYINTARSIVGAVAGLKNPSTGQLLNASINSATPKYQYGGEVVWAPAYGKDSIGSNHIIRSDTFFKLGVYNIAYNDQGASDSGMRYQLGVGKTYFLTHWLGFRVVASENYMQTILITNGVSQKAYRFFAIVEAGLVFYI